MSIDAYPFIPGQARGVAADVVLTRNTSTHATHLMKHQQSKRQAMVQLTHTAHPHQTSLKLSVARSPPFTPLLLDAPSKNDILLLRAVLLPPSVAQALRGFTVLASVHKKDPTVSANTTSESYQLQKAGATKLEENPASCRPSVQVRLQGLPSYKQPI
eukprot:205424-Pelagomonas_calceolata.AAC.1